MNEALATATICLIVVPILSILILVLIQWYRIHNKIDEIRGHRENYMKRHKK